MTTGDIKNNLRKLEHQVKMIKYPDEVDVKGLTKGVPSAFLPLYHYVFVNFSPVIAEIVAGVDVDLYGKTDLRFMDGVYKVFREVFHYKPSVTKDQFFANGFAERKIIMCTEVLQMVRGKVATKAKPVSRPSSRSIVNTTGNKQPSLTENRLASSNSRANCTESTTALGNKGKRKSSQTKPAKGKAKDSRQSQSDVSSQDVHHPQVVNEIINVGSSMSVSDNSTITRQLNYDSSEAHSLKTTLGQTGIQTIYAQPEPGISQTQPVVGIGTKLSAVIPTDPEVPVCITEPSQTALPTSMHSKVSGFKSLMTNSGYAIDSHPTRLEAHPVRHEAHPVRHEAHPVPGLNCLQHPGLNQGLGSGVRPSMHNMNSGIRGVNKDLVEVVYMQDHLDSRTSHPYRDSAGDYVTVPREFWENLLTRMSAMETNISRLKKGQNVPLRDTGATAVTSSAWDSLQARLTLLENRVMMIEDVGGYRENKENHTPSPVKCDRQRSKVAHQTNRDETLPLETTIENVQDFGRRVEKHALTSTLKRSFENKENYPNQKDYPDQTDYPDQRDYQQQRDYQNRVKYTNSGDHPNQDYPVQVNCPNSGDYANKDYPDQRDYPNQMKYPNSGDHIRYKDNPIQGNYPNSGDHLNQDNPQLTQQKDYPIQINNPESGEHLNQKNYPQHKDYPNPEDYPNNVLYDSLEHVTTDVDNANTDQEVQVIGCYTVIDSNVSHDAQGTRLNVSSPTDLSFHASDPNTQEQAKRIANMIKETKQMFAVSD